ncbi:MAG TPA: hypothetical protein VMZ71_07125, partial [Gemmataceae bacterium]|nr:hypothetical protein [Gemmataceae bacterium]
FAGVSNGALLVAGGANFPDKKPWDGGKKVWTDRVFVLDKPDGEWKDAGKLPRPLGYGVSVSHRTGVVCVGGCDAERHSAATFRLEWKDGKLVTTPLPSLPVTAAYLCGALLGDDLFVAGGQEKPDSPSALKTAYRINLGDREPKWERLADIPGSGRMLAVSAAHAGAFWVVGGVELVPGRKYLKDAHRYDPGRGWSRVKDFPTPVAASPSPAPSDETGFFVLGGDDGSQVGVGPDKHRGFSRTVVRFDAKTGEWVPAGELAAARVTVPCVVWGMSWVVPSGEVRPGVRSPEVWRK